MKVFLTFDDGPSPEVTPKVLEILKTNSIKATFFIVAKKAIAQPELVKQILSGGHSIGDHSLDHRYRNYFATLKQTKEWISKSQKQLESICHKKPVAFRSPAGIWTPKLAFALKQLGIPWIHWNIRFFDTTRTLTKVRVDKKMSKIVRGSIILLHDSQSNRRAGTFLSSLQYLIERLKSSGFTFDKI